MPSGNDGTFRRGRRRRSELNNDLTTMSELEIADQSSSSSSDDDPESSGGHQFYEYGGSNYKLLRLPHYPRTRYKSLSTTFNSNTTDKGLFSSSLVIPKFSHPATVNVSRKRSRNLSTSSDHRDQSLHREVCEALLSIGDSCNVSNGALQAATLEESTVVPKDIDRFSDWKQLADKCIANGCGQCPSCRMLKPEFLSSTRYALLSDLIRSNDSEPIRCESIVPLLGKPLPAEGAEPSALASALCLSGRTTPHSSRAATPKVNFMSQEVLSASDSGSWVGSPHKFEAYVRRYVLSTETPIEQNPWTTFRVGLYFGALFIQVIVLILAWLYLKPLPVVWEPALRMFRSCFISAFFVFLIGINTYGWRASGVNHVLIFEIDPRNHLTHYELLEVAGLMAGLWAGGVLLFLYSTLLGIQSYIAPFCLTMTFVVYMFNPFKFGHFKARRWLLNILWRIFAAPFYRVNFADFWLADQLNSLAIVFSDFAFFICYFACQHDWTDFNPLFNKINTISTNSSVIINHRGGSCTGIMFGLAPFIRILPAWFRFAQCFRRYLDMDQKQCFPHLVNAGKYSTTFFVVFFSTLSSLIDVKFLVGLWILASVVSTIYCYTWDILMDWGLLDKHSKETFLLRDELVYEYKWYYYGAMLEDLILRLTWTVDAAAVRYRWSNVEVLRTGLALGEVIRRFIWNYFRLENEHLNNCGQFRAVRDIFIAPIRANEANGNAHNATHCHREPVHSENPDRINAVFATVTEQQKEDLYRIRESQEVPVDPVDANPATSSTDRARVRNSVKFNTVKPQAADNSDIRILLNNDKGDDDIVDT